jgi:peptidoglycan/LPS O-acetylase OafA/YrhL
MSDDEGYVYEPGVNETITPADREFDWRGWTLVATVVFALVVSPAIILFHPPDALPFFVAYLVLPLAPAVLLGIVAVWAAVRS